MFHLVSQFPFTKNPMKRWIHWKFSKTEHWMCSLEKNIKHLLIFCYNEHTPQIAFLVHVSFSLILSLSFVTSCEVTGFPSQKWVVFSTYERNPFEPSQHESNLGSNQWSRGVCGRVWIGNFYFRGIHEIPISLWFSAVLCFNQNYPVLLMQVETFSRDPGSPNLRMVSWNLNTLRFVWVIVHPKTHPLTFGEPGSLGFLNIGNCWIRISTVCKKKGVLRGTTVAQQFKARLVNVASPLMGDTRWASTLVTSAWSYIEPLYMAL